MNSLRRLPRSAQVHPTPRLSRDTQKRQGKRPHEKTDLADSVGVLADELVRDKL